MGNRRTTQSDFRQGASGRFHADIIKLAIFLNGPTPIIGQVGLIPKLEIPARHFICPIALDQMAYELVNQLSGFVDSIFLEISNSYIRNIIRVMSSKVIGLFCRRDSANMCDVDGEAGVDQGLFRAPAG